MTMPNTTIDPHILDMVNMLQREIKFTVEIDLSDYERDILVKGLMLARTPTPSNYARVMELMDELTLLESEYNYIIYSLLAKFEQLNLSFRTQYDPLFATLTRSGIPNQAAVESATLSKDNGKLQLIKSKVVRLEQIINYLKTEAIILKSKSKTYDAKRSNTF